MGINLNLNKKMSQLFGVGLNIETNRIINE